MRRGRFEMRNPASLFRASRYPVSFFLMLAFSVLVGALIGLRTPVDPLIMLYLIILCNTLVFAYIVLLRNITYGILIYLYSLIFLNFYWRVALPGKVPDLDIPRLVFAFIWVVFLLEIGLGNRRLLPRTRIEVAMFAVLAAVLFSMVFVGQLQIRLFLNGFAVPYAMFIIGKNAFRAKEDVRRLLIWGALPLAIYFPVNHFFEFFRMKQFVFPRYILNPMVAGRTVHWGERTLGAFLQPVATGLALISMFVLALYVLSKFRSRFARILSWLLTAITPISVFLILSRGVYLGFFVAMSTVLLLSRKLKVYALVIIVGAGLAVLGNWAAVQTDERSEGGLASKETAISRLVLLEASMRMFADHPFVGVGFHEFETYSLPYVRQVRATVLGMRESWMGKGLKQHNHYLNTLTEMGLLAFIPEVLVLYFLFSTLIKARKVHDDAIDHDFVVVVLAILGTYLTTSMFMEPRFFEFMNTFPLLLAGIAVGSYQRKLAGVQQAENTRGE
jgi:O-antigen ligase